MRHLFPNLALPALLIAIWIAAAELEGTLHIGNLAFASAGQLDRAEPEHGCAEHGPFSRIASAALLTDELLLELIGAERLSAVSFVVDWENATPVSDAFPENLPRTDGGAEQLLHLRPDLVVVSDYNAVGTTHALRTAGMCVVHVPAPRSFAALLEQLLRLGRITGDSEQARKIVASWEATLRALEPPASDARRPRTLLLQGRLSYGSDTLQNECLQRAGYRNVVAEAGLSGMPRLNTEQLLLFDPDLIFLASQSRAVRRLSAEELPGGPAWGALGAVHQNRVYSIPSRWLNSASHHVLRACQAMADLHGRLSHGGDSVGDEN